MTTETRPTGMTRQIAGWQPGMELFGFPGESLKGFSPHVPNLEFFQHAKLILTILASNLDLPLAVLLLDPSETNFSGWRGAMEQARQRFQTLQRWLIDSFHTPVYRWKVRQWAASDPAIRKALEETVRLRGTKGINVFRHVWHAQEWPYIEPTQEGLGVPGRELCDQGVRLRGAGRSAGRAAELIADRMAAIEDPTVRAATAMEVFGRSGTMLLPMLGNLREVREEARRRGLVPSEQAVKGGVFGKIASTVLGVDLAADEEASNKFADHEKSLADADAGLQNTWNKDDTTALKDFYVASAQKYLNLVTAWAGAFNTPWTSLVVGLAQVELTRVTSLGGKLVAHATAAGLILVDFLQDLTTESKEFAHGVAGGLKTQTDSLADALHGYASDRPVPKQDRGRVLAGDDRNVTVLVRAEMVSLRFQAAAASGKGPKVRACAASSTRKLSRPSAIVRRLYGSSA